MLSEARKKTSSLNWIHGTSENIPFPDSSFDGAIATLCIHHWEYLDKGFAELCRVLKPKAKLVIFTALPEQMHGYWLIQYFPKMLYASIEQMPAMKQIEQASLQAGPELKDLFLYSGKHKAEIYFSDPVRQGISSFASLANKEEVEKGLRMLSKDIATNHFETVKKKFENDLGDYFFLTLEK
jgi:SAM-dependent methyltransferase